MNGDNADGRSVEVVMTVTKAVGTREVPESMLALHALAGVDYVDQFSLATEVDADPERWARAMFGDVPTPGERLIWSGILGLRLARGPSPVTVAGWSIAARGDGWIRLEARSGTRAANLVVQIAPAMVSVGTFMSHERRPGRWFWRPLSAVHRRLMPWVLRSAAARIRATRAA